MLNKTEYKFKRKNGVVFQKVDGLVHILDEKDDAIITLNQTASFIWTHLSKPSTLDEIAKILVAEYKVKYQKASKDCGEFIKMMDKRKLLSKI